MEYFYNTSLEPYDIEREKEFLAKLELEDEEELEKEEGLDEIFKQSKSND